SATVRDWLYGSYKALRGEFARSQFSDLVPGLLDRLARSENPDGAIAAFDTFIRGLQRGARLFSLLKQNPDPVTLVALTLGRAGARLRGLSRPAAHVQPRADVPDRRPHPVGDGVGRAGRRRIRPDRR